MEKSSFKRKHTNGIDSAPSGKEFKKTPHHHKGSPHDRPFQKYEKYPQKDYKKKNFNRPSLLSKIWSFIVLIFTCGFKRHTKKPLHEAQNHCKGCTCHKKTVSAPKREPREEAPTAPVMEAPQQPVKARLSDDEIAKYKAQFYSNPDRLAVRYRKPIASSPNPEQFDVRSEDGRSASIDNSDSEHEPEANDEEDFDTLVESDVE